jgi:RNA polymerase sigma-70 factor, ECF subfamily
VWRHIDVVPLALTLLRDDVAAPLVAEPPAVSEDADLVARARAGDAAALDALARRELPRVERLLGKLLGPRRDLEDLVQTVFVELMRSLDRFRGESQLSTFVGGITVQIARRAMRRSAWDRRKLPMPEVEMEAPEPAIDDVAHHRAQLAALRIALDALSEEHRVALLLWALEGLEPSTIAEMTGATVSATRSRIWWAQKHLRRAAAREPLLHELVGDQGEP